MGRSQRSEAPTAVAPVVVSWQSAEDISFEADQADIIPRCAKKIELLAAWVKTHPMFEVALDARADEVMTGEKDPRLGERRVSAVRAALVAAGVIPARIHAAAFSDRRRSPARAARRQSHEARNQGSDGGEHRTFELQEAGDRFRDQW